MDFVLLSAALKLFKRLKAFLFNYQLDIFGTGAAGNYYVSPTNANLPLGYTFKQTALDGTWTVPVSFFPHFNNLYIDTGSKVTFDAPYFFLHVKGKLTVNGILHMNAKGNNQFNFSSFMQKPSKGGVLPAYTAACFKTFVSNREIRNTLDLIACGGNANGIAVSGGGSTGGGGGLIVIYTPKDGFTYVAQPQICANGGKTGGTGGGMLFIFAQQLEVGPTGAIQSNGGDGAGPVSYIDDIPRATDASGNPNTGAVWGGAGQVYKVTLD